MNVVFGAAVKALELRYWVFADVAATCTNVCLTLPVTRELLSR
jgi:hypothetical protein